MNVPRRVFVVGATGTIGRATVRALVQRGHEVVCFVRPQTSRSPSISMTTAPEPAPTAELAGATLRYGNVQDPSSVVQHGFKGEPFNAVVSCMASRTGVAQDAWAIDHQAQLNVLAAAQAAGVQQFVLLSALCVQKPRLAFQHAKLAFEQALVGSGMPYSIVRPTAFFKSLSGQVKRVQQGKPYLLFGNGQLTACKPISDQDLADYLVSCLHDPSLRNRVLPIGGPGPAITPLQQGQYLFKALQREPKFRHVPLGLMYGIVGLLGTAGRVLPGLAAKAELARIGRYYASESMLVWDAAQQRYDADATPSTGTQTLFSHYDALLAGHAQTALGEHRVFR